MKVPALIVLLVCAATMALVAGSDVAVAQFPAAAADVRAAIARDGWASVIVELKTSDTSARDAATELPTRDRRRTMLERRRSAIAMARGAVAQDMDALGLGIERAYDHLPMVVTRADAAQLERLLRHPEVKAVHLNEALERPHGDIALPGAVLGVEVVAVGEAAMSGGAPTVSGERAARTAAHVTETERAQLATTVGYINADKAWTRGFTGAGTAIAVLDDGIDRNHDMFVGGKIVAAACFSDRVKTTDQSLCPLGATSSTAIDAASACNASLDACGHGSHVAGIAAGNDTTGPTTLRGVAYDARLVPIQVFSIINDAEECDNQAPCLRAYVSAVLSALNHVIAIAAQHNIAAVNLSLGGNAQTGACDGDVRKAAIDTLRTMGILVTASAGNDGELNKVTAPACISSTVAVSSTIITLPDSEANQAPNVDLLAPGVIVRSAGLGNTYQTRSGTSSAAPHVAGAIALIRSARPSATADQIEAALKSGGIASSLSTWTWTTPRIDINAALNLLGAGGGVPGVVVPGVYGSLNGAAQSNLRFFNPTQSAGTVTVRIVDDTSGNLIATWTRTIAGLTAPQVSMQTIESEASPRITPVPGNGQFYSLFVDAPFDGFVQHVLWNPSAASLTNVSGCDNGLADNGRDLANIHTSLISNYTSYLLIHNSGNSAARPSFDVRDARTGQGLGTFTTTGEIKAHASALVNVGGVLESFGQAPQSGQFHLNMSLRPGFEGFAQHWVDNQGARLITNMTARCAI
ncbi:MAG: S8 family serine peptidase [Rhodospirillaceae bacterium]|nr:S8 family serine peptidase [Rhodospirillaceae bacterium]